MSCQHLQFCQTKSNSTYPLAILILQEWFTTFPWFLLIVLFTPIFVTSFHSCFMLKNLSPNKKLHQLTVVTPNMPSVVLLPESRVSDTLKKTPPLGKTPDIRGVTLKNPPSLLTVMGFTFILSAYNRPFASRISTYGLWTPFLPIISITIWAASCGLFALSALSTISGCTVLPCWTSLLQR